MIGKDGSVASKGAAKGARSTSSFSTSSTQPSTTSSSYRGSTPSSSGKGHPRRQVHLATTNAAADAEPGDEEFMDTIEEEPHDDDQDANDQAPDEQFDDEQAEEEDCDVNELLQVLTLTAKRLSDQTLARKFTNRPEPEQQSKLTAQDKSTTHCSACGAVGHWHKDPECPRKKLADQLHPLRKRVPPRVLVPRGHLLTEWAFTMTMEAWRSTKPLKMTTR